MPWDAAETRGGKHRRCTTSTIPTRARPTVLPAARIRPLVIIARMRLLREGRASRMYDLGDGRVLRQYKHGGSPQQEAELMRVAHDGGVHVPKVFEVLDDGLLLERKRPRRRADVGDPRDEQRRSRKAPRRPICRSGQRDDRTPPGSRLPTRRQQPQPRRTSGGARTLPLIRPLDHRQHPRVPGLFVDVPTAVATNLPLLNPARGAPSDRCPLILLHRRFPNLDRGGRALPQARRQSTTSGVGTRDRNSVPTPISSVIMRRASRCPARAGWACRA